MTGAPAWAELILLASAVLTAVGYITRRWIWPALRGTWRLVHGTLELVEDYRQSGGFAGLSEQVAEVKALAKSSHRELHPNGGTSMRDTVNATALGVQSIGEKADALEGYATQNRQGIADLNRRFTDLDEKVDAQGGRITDHRRRNDETIASLRQFIETEHRDALLANEALRASLAEALQVDRELRREE